MVFVLRFYGEYYIGKEIRHALMRRWCYLCRYSMETITNALPPKIVDPLPSTPSLRAPFTQKKRKISSPITMSQVSTDKTKAEWQFRRSYSQSFLKFDLERIVRFAKFFHRKKKRNKNKKKKKKKKK